MRVFPAVLASSGVLGDQPEWCPVLHTIRGIDPSGPILVGDTWHVYDTGGGWAHWTSKDLFHWTQQPRAPFFVATGSVTVDAAGQYMGFYGNTTTPDPATPGFPCCDIERAISPSSNMTTWARTGKVIVRPKDLSLHQGFRDAHRPIRAAGAWWMGVGTGSGADNVTPLVGRIRWFKGDETMSTWEDHGNFFEWPATHGYTDPETMVWNASYHRPFNQIECPDVFHIGNHTVVMGSLQFDGPWQGTSTTWWVGDVDSLSTRFQPKTVGLVDYGQNYAARTGGPTTATVAAGSGSGSGSGADLRRVLFAFSGYRQPTLEPGCGDPPGFYYLVPRELTVGRCAAAPSAGHLAAGTRAAAAVGTAAAAATVPCLRTWPVPELASALRGKQQASAVTAAGNTAVASGVQLDVSVTCTGRLPKAGKVELALLADAGQGGAHLAVGYDFGRQELFADHASIGNATIRQFAPLPLVDVELQQAEAPAAGALQLLRVVVDGAMVESFAGGVALTTFVTPTGSAAPKDRVVKLLRADATCTVDVWSLAL